MSLQIDLLSCDRSLSSVLNSTYFFCVSFINNTIYMCIYIYISCPFLLCFIKGMTTNSLNYILTPSLVDSVVPGVQGNKQDDTVWSISSSTTSSLKCPVPQTQATWPFPKHAIPLHIHSCDPASVVFSAWKALHYTPPGGSLLILQGSGNCIHFQYLLPSALPYTVLSVLL